MGHRLGWGLAFSLSLTACGGSSSPGGGTGAAALSGDLTGNWGACMAPGSTSVEAPPAPEAPHIEPAPPRPPAEGGDGGTVGGNSGQPGTTPGAGGTDLFHRLATLTLVDPPQDPAQDPPPPPRPSTSGLGVWVGMVLAGGPFRSDFALYSNNGCAGTPEMKVVVTGSYETGRALPELDGAGEMDVSVRTASMTLFNPEDIRKANEARRCGYADWAAGVPKEIAGTDCVKPEDLSHPQYTIYRVSGNRLYLGEDDKPDHDGSTPAKRHRRLSKTGLPRL